MKNKQLEDIKIKILANGDFKYLDVIVFADLEVAIRSLKKLILFTPQNIRLLEIDGLDGIYYDTDELGLL